MSTVLLILDDEAVNAAASEALARRGAEPRVAGSVVEAVEWLSAHRTADVSAIVLDAAVLRAETQVWLAARSGDRRLAAVPVIVLAHDASADGMAGGGARDEVVPYAAGIPGLAEAVLRAAKLPTPPARVALGTERALAARVTVDLHTYAHSKLVQYLGESRAAAVLQAITAHLPDGRIVTTQDLHDVARRLKALGELESNVATLLSGRAVLLDSDRTLRR